jgi:hypothetical protein
MEDDAFLELLMNNIRNEVISYQSFINKTINANVKKISDELAALKKNYVLNFEKISELELKMREINDIKVSSILEKNSNFNTLHSEKITPFFLKMAKGYQHESSMRDICNYNGEHFATLNEQKNFIRSHFANSFKKPRDEPADLQGCIERFLGEEILNHPLVANLKLDENERNRLDEELTLAELDKAVDEANVNSAAGIDGISLKFIKRYWHVFRVPLKKYADKAFVNGRLTHNFRTALIKLIPKKGSSSDIKKWRPISLLSCMYKILSRAINNRLKSVVNRFTSRAQKGFTNHRYIQEVLINVCATINHCNANNIEGALLSIDQSRAFDTISHKYMSEVYKFFGFGGNFVRFMDTIGTGRTASIIFDDGSISTEFDLETGRPQGDGPSPLQYNMGEEIVLLKIELDTAVRSVFQHALAPRFAMDLVPDPRRKGIDTEYNTHFSQESNRETDKADGFADDNSTATMAEPGSLRALRDICNDFSKFSGLQSNADKTTLLQIGRVGILTNEILDLGFTVTNRVKILGMEIDRELSTLSNHFEDVGNTISRMIEHWERFNLSLAGRISVCKTFMLSQVGYLGCIISPSELQLTRMQKQMDNFCLGSMKVAKKRLYLPPCEGGLGLINLKNFITALQCTWVKRVTQHWGDTWRFDLKAKCYGNPLIANEKTFSLAENPILFNICKSFGKFAEEFYGAEDNYKKAFIFRNPLFRRGRNDDGLLCERFFGNNFGELCKIAKLKFEDFFTPRGTKTLDELNREFDLNFTLVTYMRTHEALQFAVLKYGNEEASTVQSLDFFLKSFDKGSKPFRKILQRNEVKKWKIANLNTVNTFLSLTNIQKPSDGILKSCWGEWNITFFSNRMREFLFKFRNNILGLNSRVCKFVPGIESECSLCVVNKEPYPIQSETFIHLFFDCCHSDRYRKLIENRFFPELRNSGETDRKKFWFFALLPGMEKTNTFISAIVSMVHFFTWESKLRKEFSPLGIFLENTEGEVKKMLKISKVLRIERSKANFFVCRHFSDPP